MDPQPAKDLPRQANRKCWSGMFLQSPCLLVPKAPNPGCLPCSLWVLLPVPGPQVMGHYSAAAWLVPKEEAEVLLLVALIAVVCAADGDGKNLVTSPCVPEKVQTHLSQLPSVSCWPRFGWHGDLWSRFLITVVCSCEGVLALLVFSSTCQGQEL